jgi:polyisoprenyl-teichoic acid--peptidoglycan teichoic acid transferase
MSRRSRSASRLGWALVLMALVATVSGASGWWWLHGRLGELRRPTLDGALTPAGSGPWNILVVGSDSRLGVDRSERDVAAMGNEGDVTGQRSDTILILRVGDGRPALLSLPRDLWVEIDGGAKNRLNSAFSKGPAALTRTVQNSLGIPIHHYLEIDFQGFKDLVDAVGGVNVWFPYASTDSHTGLNQPSGCHRLDGVSALAYARSRYLEYFDGFVWRTDGTGDLGRVQRQQDLLTRLALRTFSEARSADRFAAVMDVMTNVVVTDMDQKALAQLGQRLRSAANGVERFTYPGDGTEIKGKSVLLPNEAAAAPIVGRFSGVVASAPTPAGPAGPAAPAVAAAPIPGKPSPNGVVAAPTSPDELACAA